MGPTSPSIRTNDARADSGVGSSPPTASAENAMTARPLTTGPTTISAPPSSRVRERTAAAASTTTPNITGPQTTAVGVKPKKATPAASSSARPRFRALRSPRRSASCTSVR